MKKFLCMLISLCMVFAMAIPCYAEEPQEILVSESHEVLDNGMECVTTITMSPSYARSSTKNGTISKNYSYSGKVVANVILNATFTYDGSTAKATGAYGSHSVASGWSYSSESTWCSGATARLTATVSGSGHSIPVSLSLTCSPSGTLS